MGYLQSCNTSLEKAYRAVGGADDPEFYLAFGACAQGGSNFPCQSQAIFGVETA